ncbi:MAG: 2-octaprenyl-6-methoxyphenyl hydroxylase [Candidatus Competibacteraceae bacterium]|nr:2-octaprenyl-6-methoxyphenyl hydroxylase [Candidatus Competibacteraceae bacterium]
MQSDYDLLIIGGGLVGASLACALADQALRIGLVEAMPFTTTSEPGYDERSIALAYGTRRIFDGLGLWPAIAPLATPIKKVHVSERGGPGFARLNCRDEGVEALGYVVEARALGAALASRLAELNNVELLCPASLETLTVQSDMARSEVRWQDKLSACTARLIVAADGARSQVRQQLGIDAVQWEYGQTAIVANVTPQYEHHNIAYERFTDSGPVALLPMSDNRCSVVCTVENSDKETLLALNDAAFLAFLQTRFGERLGCFKRAGRRQAYPLLMLKAREHTRPRVAVIGNAAHTLHPIAGQGFNVGMRDVAVLAEVIADALRVGEDFGTATVLARYAEWRRWDQRQAVAFTDGLARLFSNPLPPLRHLRNLGLLAFDLLPPVKRLLARRTMGMTGYLPRLARGLPLATEKGL